MLTCGPSGACLLLFTSVRSETFRRWPRANVCNETRGFQTRFYLLNTATMHRGLDTHLQPRCASSSSAVAASPLQRRHFPSTFEANVGPEQNKTMCHVKQRRPLNPDPEPRPVHVIPPAAASLLPSRPQVLWASQPRAPDNSAAEPD